MTMTLYHGSSSQIETIKNDGLFGGVFTTPDKEAALSHGNILHAIEIEPSDLLTTYTLTYKSDYTSVLNIVRSQLNACDESEIDEVFDLIVSDGNVFTAAIDNERLCEILGSEDLAHAGWEIQRIRGFIAKKLNYKAVEMRDEHGTTYLVLPGVDIKKMDA